jgi:prepilin-type processing-associated H-X9-DG protein
MKEAVNFAHLDGHVDTTGVVPRDALAPAPLSRTLGFAGLGAGFN